MNEQWTKIEYALEQRKLALDAKSKYVDRIMGVAELGFNGCRAQTLENIEKFFEE